MHEAGNGFDELVVRQWGLACVGLALHGILGHCNTEHTDTGLHCFAGSKTIMAVTRATSSWCVRALQGLTQTLDPKLLSAAIANAWMFGWSQSTCGCY